MKKLFLLGFFIGGVFFAHTASAQMGMMSSGQNPSQASSTAINTSLQTIYQSQKVNSLDKIDCSKITDTQLENLGDAVMGFGISEQQHTAMENMMGGEGSESLKQAHINMGKSYLNCPGYPNGRMGMAMMNGHGLQNYQNDYPEMMYRGHFFLLCLIMIVSVGLSWAFLILAIIALLKWIKLHK